MAEGSFLVEDQVTVGFPFDPVLSMKFRFHFFGGLNDNIGGEETVQPPPETLHGDRSGGPEIGHLTQRVHPGIRPSGSNQADMLPGHDFYFLFNDLLNRQAIGLNLPPVIIRAVVFNQKLDVAHEISFGFRVKPPHPSPLPRKRGRGRGWGKV